MPGRDPTALPVIPELEGEYDLVRELGRGGTAVVYLAREREPGRDVAIKLIPPSHVPDDEAAARLLREARTVGRLQHPNIVMLLGSRRLDGGGLALVFPFVPGRTLKEAIQEQGPMDAAEVERVLLELGRALAYAHRRRIVHRDVKPQNVYLDEDTGIARLADFGIARSWDSDSGLTLPGTALGTPTYMSPEQLDGGDLDGRSDLYSLGLVGWEMLTGEQPWAGEGLYSVIYKQKHEALPDLSTIRPDAPPRLLQAVNRALEKEPSRRWGNAEAFIAALEGRSPSVDPGPPRVSEGAPGTGAVGTAPLDAGDSAELLPLAPARHPLSAIVALLALVLVTGLAAVALLDEPEVRVRSLLAQILPMERIEGVLQADSRATPPPEANGRPLASGGDDTPGEAGPLPGDRVVFPEDGTGEAFEAGATRPAPPDPEDGDTVETDPAVPIEAMAIEAMPVEAMPVESAEAPGQASVEAELEEDTVPARVEPPPDERLAPPPSSGAATSPDPPPVRLAVRPSLVSGGMHSCRLDGGGALVCWGDGGRGVGSLTSGSSGLSGLAFARVTAGLGHTCALDLEGRAHCWGANDHGQLGDGTTMRRDGPSLVTGVPALTAIEAGASHTCGRSDRGEVFCWGDNGEGQLGDGTTVGRPTPVRVLSEVRLGALAAGWSHTCALDDGGSAYCWGRNAAGELGRADRGRFPIPTRVAGVHAFRQLSAGNAFTCGLTTEGRIYCWGDNSQGQLGSRVAGTHHVPLPLEADGAFASVTAGAVHACALAASGEAFCWGRNLYGQVGDGSTDDRRVPVQARGAHRFDRLHAFGSHTCGESSEGRLYCWGYNADGQLGDGSRENRSFPVMVVP